MLDFFFSCFQGWCYDVFKTRLGVGKCSPISGAWKGQSPTLIGSCNLLWKWSSLSKGKKANSTSFISDYKRIFIRQYRSLKFPTISSNQETEEIVYPWNWKMFSRTRHKFYLLLSCLLPSKNAVPSTSFHYQKGCYLQRPYQHKTSTLRQIPDKLAALNKYWYFISISAIGFPCKSVDTD